MSEVFIDTSGWASFFLPSENHHAAADGLVRGWLSGGAVLVTTNYVLSEAVALFTSPLRIPRPLVLRNMTVIRSASWVEIVHVDATLDRESWDLLNARPDKGWSLVDCSSFVLMRQRGITEALTTDHHFEQAGFVRLLK